MDNCPIHHDDQIRHAIEDYAGGLCSMGSALGC